MSSEKVRITPNSLARRQSLIPRRDLFTQQLDMFIIVAGSSITSRRAALCSRLAMRNFHNTVVDQRHVCRWLQGPGGSLFVAHFVCCVQLHRLSCGSAGGSPRRLGMGVRVECALALVITVHDGRLCSTVRGAWAVFACHDCCVHECKKCIGRCF
jgi:hypothetical protein